MGYPRISNSFTTKTHFGRHADTLHKQTQPACFLPKLLDCSIKTVNQLHLLSPPVGPRKLICEAIRKSLQCVRLIYRVTVTVGWHTCVCLDIEITYWTLQKICALPFVFPWAPERPIHKRKTPVSSSTISSIWSIPKPAVKWKRNWCLFYLSWELRAKSISHGRIPQGPGKHGQCSQPNMLPGC